MKKQKSSKLSILYYLVFTIILIVSGFGLHKTIGQTIDHKKWVDHTYTVISKIDSIMSDLKDAEMSLRVFLLTKQESYLDSYRQNQNLFPEKYLQLKNLVGDNPRQLDRLELFDKKVREIFSEREDLIKASKAEKSALIQAWLTSRATPTQLDQLGTFHQLMVQEETALLDHRTKAVENSFLYLKLIISAFVVGCFILASLSYFLLRKNFSKQLEENWIQKSQIGIAQRIREQKTADGIVATILKFLAEELSTQVAVFYEVVDRKLTVVGTYGAIKHEPSQKLQSSLSLESFKQEALIHLNYDDFEKPQFSTSISTLTPKCISALPLVFEGEVLGVVEIGYLKPLARSSVLFIERIFPTLAATLASDKANRKVQYLLEETQAQAEELSAQQEELQQNNEVLQKQTEDLGHSKKQLEMQQDELMQVNHELEEQAVELEEQRRILAKSNRELEDSQFDIERKAAELQVASRYKSEFLANMSHELRTPLNSILILASLLKENQNANLSEKEVEFAKSIHSSGTDLLSLLNDILDLSKVEAGKLDVHNEEVDLKEMFDNLTRSFSPLCANKKIDFIADPVPKMIKEIETDRVRLEQILKNFLSNAIKFTKTGFVKLSVQAENTEALRFCIQDTGIGIPVDKREKIFEAFTQADGSTNRKYGGTGLGLTICKKLASLLGGTINLESEVDVGSTFCLILPFKTVVAKTVEIETENTRGNKSSEKPEFQSFRNSNLRQALQKMDFLGNQYAKNILIVEDESVQSNYLSSLLSFSGVHIDTAENAASALRLLKEKNYECMILDLHLPDMSGTDFLEMLSKEKMIKRPPVFVYTAKDVSAAEEKHLKNFAEVVIIKGAKSPERLLDEVMLFMHYLDEKKPQQLKENKPVSSVAKKSKKIFENKTVLIADDDMRNVFALANALEGIGLKIKVARNGQETVDIVTKDPSIDVVLMDIMMPGMDGYEAMRQIRDNPETLNIPIIALTAKAMKSDQEKCKEAGANDYLSKPVNLDQLVSLLKTWMPKGKTV